MLKTGTLLEALRPGDRATILTPHGGKLTGRVVMKFPTHAVLNMGGRHGTPGIADVNNLINIKKRK